MMRRLFGIVLVACAFVIGCAAGRKEPIALDKVPDLVLKTAKEKLPGVTFYRAVITTKGEYELMGKDAKGKIREIYVMPDGKVTGTE